jgi:hypothetical protein
MEIFPRLLRVCVAEKRFVIYVAIFIKFCFFFSRATQVRDAAVTGSISITAEEMILIVVYKLSTYHGLQLESEDILFTFTTFKPS